MPPDGMSGSVGGSWAMDGFYGLCHDPSIKQSNRVQSSVLSESECRFNQTHGA